MRTPDRLDLTSYGIRLVLEKGQLRDTDLVCSILQQGSFSFTQGRFDLPSGSYSLGPILGKGTYGKTYQAIHTTLNQVFAIKVIDLKGANIASTIKESIIHILMEKDSQTQPNGPYVPHFYEIAYDPLRHYILLRMERLHGDISNLFYGSTKEQNDAIVPKVLGDLAHIMNHFHKTLQFNHRDMKSDNVGFVLDSTGNYVIKLIDFGFSCITWKGVQITGGLYFSIRDPCYIPSRDLTGMLYELFLNYKNYFSDRLLKFIASLLTFHSCKMHEGCRLGRYFVGAKDWRGTYDFLNNPRFHNPHAVPKALHGRVLEFMGHAPTPHTTPVAAVDAAITSKIKMCLPEQVLNPKTRRCVHRSGKVGRQILRQMELSTPSPTRKSTHLLAPCKAGQVRNPATRRCVQRSGKVGRQILRQMKLSTPSPTRKSTHRLAPCKAGQVRNPATRRCKYTCHSSQLRNPATKRCVSRNGPLGRKLWAQGVRPSLARVGF